jgi:ribosomal-protein-alanine N-acetyltransferase
LDAQNSEPEENCLMRTPSFETPRLRLRPFREDDAPALHRILLQPDMLTYFPWPKEPPLEKVERFVRQQIEQWTSVGYAWWAVELKPSGLLVGWNGLQFLPETRETEIGFLIDRSHWHRGLTTEAARVGLQYGFEELELSEIIALAHPDNVASRRVIEKLGMRFDRATEYFGMRVARYTLARAEYGTQAKVLSSANGLVSL